MLYWREAGSIRGRHCLGGSPVKRPVVPVSEYFEHESYPPIDPDLAPGPCPELVSGGGAGAGAGAPAVLSRRGFWGRLALVSATGMGAGAGATLLSVPAAAGSDPKDRRERVSIDLRGFFIGKQTSLVGRSLLVLTGDRGLARWLRRRSNLGPLLVAIRRVLRAAKEDTLTDGKKLLHLERKLGAEIRRGYRVKTGRTARALDVMLEVRSPMVSRTVTRIAGGVGLPRLHRRRPAPSRPRRRPTP